MSGNKANKASLESTSVWGVTKNIRIDKIVDRHLNRKLDHDVVSNIAESLNLVGVINPIAVRRDTRWFQNKMRAETVLVAGAHRLEAARWCGLKEIPCRFVANDDVFADLVRFAEDLFRKNPNVLEESDLLMRWYRQRELVISGQDGQ
jgi:ParB-like chromosome segregation protein Spo0J